MGGFYASSLSICGILCSVITGSLTDDGRLFTDEFYLNVTSVYAIVMAARSDAEAEIVQQLMIGGVSTVRDCVILMLQLTSCPKFTVALNLYGHCHGG